MAKKTAYITTTVLDTIEDDGTAEALGMTFEEYAEEQANAIAWSISDLGYAVNDIETECF